MSPRSVDLGARLEALATAVELGEARCDPAALAPARSLLGRAAQRRRLSPERTVVALAGGTGSGKSSLFNALTGAALAPTGVRRPTTSRSRAAIWPAASADAGADDVAALLDWLEIRDRHGGIGANGPPDLAGLVLVDLPDFDSTAAEHRLEAERMTAVVDLLVWVVDPQKYADAAVHERYLRPLAAHRDVMLVVLNQADRLDAGALDACRRHLTHLLDEDGLSGVPVLPVSATRGDGLAQLRAALAERVRTRQSALARLHADADAAVTALEPYCAGTARSRSAARAGSQGEEVLVRALAAAAGTEPTAQAAAGSYRLQAIARVGWPVTSWLSRLRPDPLRRLHLGAGSSGPRSGPAATATQRAQVSNAVREVIVQRTSQLAPVWQASARAAVDAHQADVPGELDRAVRAGVPPPNTRPHWWAAVRALQLLFVALAAVGLLWLAGLAALAYLQLSGSSPHVGRAPLPTLLLVGGLILGLLTSVGVRPFVAIGARGRQSRARRALETGVRDVARRNVLAPLDAELDVADRFCTAVGSARR